MYKVFISIKKEFLLLINDKVGLTLMFAMPLLLVFIITIIQDSAFKLVNSNRISLLVSSQDTGTLGQSLILQLKNAGMFDVIEDNSLDSAGISRSISHKKALTGLYISADFSEKLGTKSKNVSNIVMADFGLADSTAPKALVLPSLVFFHDPVLQENYCYSIINMLNAQLNGIETGKLIESFYTSMGYDSVPQGFRQAMQNNAVPIQRVNVTGGDASSIPNSAQHNVPAWTVFAMFFMVVSLGTNIVKERTMGSFLRLKTMPTAFTLVLFSKQLIYIMVAVLQVVLIFSMGIFVFPHIGLPELTMPTNLTGTVLVVLLSGAAAVSYALLIGSLANTQEQANGAGAVSIVIFAALGGVWVPSFVMPDYLQVVSMFSPLHWCIEGFYVLFLKNGNWTDLLPIMYILLGFSLLCQLITMVRLKLDKLI